jgi:hypothetical protein
MHRHGPRTRIRTLLLVSLLTFGLLGSSGGTIASAGVSSTTPVMSKAPLTEAEVLAWFNSRHTGDFNVNTSKANLVRYYREEGERMGVRWDVAFAQSILETGWFRFSSGMVVKDDNNYSGLGAFDGSGGASVFRFPTPRMGVRAQMQHLKLYGDPTTNLQGTNLGIALAEDVENRYPTRWRVVRGEKLPDGSYRYAGRVPNWEQFGNGMWATDPLYSCKVLNLYRQMLEFNGKKADGLPTNPSCLRTWHLRHHNSGGVANSLGYLGREGDHVLACDWNGNGQDTPATFDRGAWTISNQRDAGGTKISFTYGRAGDLPLCGDWNGDGKDTIGIIRDGDWHLKNRLAGGSSDVSFTYGRVTRGDVPVVGDWNGNGQDTIGIIRGGEWHLRNSLSGGRGQIVFTYGRITSGDRPLVGDWNADGKDGIGIVRGGEWHLRNRLSGGPAENTFVYGRVAQGDVPVTGDWTGDGTDTPGIVR